MSESEKRPDAEEVQTCYIVKTPNVCFGKPRIRGTRMAVRFIVTEYIHMQMSPRDIWNAHPHLTMAQIHAALSYYYDHRLEIEKEMVEGEEFAIEMERQQKEEKERLS